jgi:hypothetical protein
MSLPRTVAVVTLVASLGGNAFFAQALSRRSRSPAEPEAAAEEEAAAPARPQAPAPRPPARSAAVAGSVTLPQASCAAQLASLQASMAEKSETLRGLLPPEPLFARGEPNPEAERLVGPIVAQALARGGATEKGLSVACKDVACKAAFVAPASIDDDAWDQVVASNSELQGWTQQFTLGPATPAGEAGGKPLVQRSLFFKLNGPRAVAAQAALAPAKAGR